MATISKKRRYDITSDKYQKANGLVKIPYTDYLGVLRHKWVTPHEVSRPKVSGVA